MTSCPAEGKQCNQRHNVYTRLFKRISVTGQSLGSLQSSISNLTTELERADSHDDTVRIGFIIKIHFIAAQTKSDAEPSTLLVTYCERRFITADYWRHLTSLQESLSDFETIPGIHILPLFPDNP